MLVPLMGPRTVAQAQEAEPARIFQFNMCGYVAYDADPDRYRIVVWSLDEGPIPGAELIYDNQPGASFDVDMANPQPISARSVAVHS